MDYKEDERTATLAPCGRGIMEWWEIEKLFTKRDREAIAKAHASDWRDIDEDWAETIYGWNEIHSIKMDKYHREED